MEACLGEMTLNIRPTMRYRDARRADDRQCRAFGFVCFGACDPWRAEGVGAGPGG